jgi:hypothetical protein
MLTTATNGGHVGYSMGVLLMFGRNTAVPLLRSFLDPSKPLVSNPSEPERSFVRPRSALAGMLLSLRLHRYSSI